jgi:hypothetical protein
VISPDRDVYKEIYINGELDIVVKFAVDSLLEDGVTSEPLSLAQFPASWKIQAFAPEYRAIAVFGRKWDHLQQLATDPMMLADFSPAQPREIRCCLIDVLAVLSPVLD